MKLTLLAAVYVMYTECPIHDVDIMTSSYPEETKHFHHG